MNKIVLLIEDLPEEQEKAKKALAEHGFRAAVTSTLEDALRIWKSLEGKLDGIITDLHFPERTSNSAEASDPGKPCGFAIIAKATEKGTPVVVCSNVNHHFCEYAKIVIETLEKFHPLKHIPFVMDNKNWDRAVEEMKKLIGKEE
jgi:CheY-like chemotaxis protein